MVMGYVFDQKDVRTELQKRVAADLTDRAKKKTDFTDMPDGVDDSAFLIGTKKTTSLMGVWISIAVIAIILLIVFIILKVQN